VLKQQTWHTNKNQLIFTLVMQTLTQTNNNKSNARPSFARSIAAVCPPIENQFSLTTTNNYIWTRGDENLLKITTLNSIFRSFTGPEDFVEGIGLLFFKFSDCISGVRLH